MSDLQATQAAVGALLSRIAEHFKGTPKVTLLVRNDLGPEKDADFVMTNDTLPAAISALQHRATSHV